MSNDVWSEAELRAFEIQMLEKVPPAESIGNKAMRRTLGDGAWNDELYETIKNRLVDRGVLQKGHGRGGSVKRAAATGPSQPATPAPSERSSRRARSDAKLAIAADTPSDGSPVPEQDLARLEGQLLGKVPPEGSIGNKDLRGRLAKDGWDEQQYWLVRNGLIDKGVLEKGRGYGGSVRRAVPEEPTLRTAAAKPGRKAVREQDLYVPMLKVVQHEWAQEYGFGPNEAYAWKSAGKKTQGKWTCPDITAVARKRFTYYPQTVFDFITFEIKPADDFNVTAVYEALAHKRFATRSYVVLHLPNFKAGGDTQPDSAEDPLADITRAATEHGIGLIVATKPDDYEGWTTVVEAQRGEPDPASVNHYLATQIEQTRQKDLQKRILDIIRL